MSMNPIDDITNYKFGIFYFNRNDPRTIVPKRLRNLGFAVNFAHPISYLLVFLILAIIVYLIYVLSGVKTVDYQ